MADQAPTPKKLTAAEAAKQVRRETVVPVVDKDGKPTGETKIKQIAVKAEEVLDFKDHGTHVVVVTTDGQKLSSALVAE
jgi:DNA-binding LytR/AlgR family response regulator